MLFGADRSRAAATLPAEDFTVSLPVQGKATREVAKGTTYRPDIDGLRALAILPVVLYHAFPSIMPAGFIGVDIFFVISGFLISGIILKSLQQNTFSYKDFYARRIRRIFPPLAIVLATMLAIGWVTMFSGEYQRLAQEAAAGAGFISNLVFWRQAGYFDSPELKPLLHLWSLGVEEQYYIFWPILLGLLWRRTGRPWVTMVSLAIGSFALNIWLISHHDSNSAFYLPFTRFWELLAGSLLAYLNLAQSQAASSLRTAPAASLKGRMLSNVLSTAGFLLLVLGLALIHEGQGFPGWWAAFPVAGTVLVIAAGSSAWLNRTLFSHPWMVSVGTISYSLYLWHWPLITLSNTLGLELSNREMRLVRLAAVVLSFALAYVTYQWIELPVRKARKFRYVPQLCAAMGLVLIVSMTILANKGFTRRFGSTQEQIALLAFKQENGSWDETARVGTCFLVTGQTEKDFAPECVGKASGSAAPGAVLIWGDSHAAHLYYGLRSVLPAADSRLWQLTSSSCPPLPGYESTQRSDCAEINDYVLNKIKQLRPGTVLLNAYWGRLPLAHFSDAELDTALSGAISDLKKAGVPKVIVVGPVPIFHNPQPKLIALATVGNQIPSRLRPAELGAQMLLDLELKQISAHAGAEYASPLSLECNRADCLVALKSEVDGIMAFDYGHLTPNGSEFLARSLLLPEIN